jgi:hypothetical protein
LSEEREHRRQMEVEREAALGLARAAEAARRIAEAARDEALARRTRANPQRQTTRAAAADEEPSAAPGLLRWRPSLPRPTLKRPSLPRPSLGRPGLIAEVGARATRSLRALTRPGVREVPLLGPIRVVPALAAAGAACLILFGLSAVGMPAGGLVVLGGALAALVYLVGTGPRGNNR